MHTELGKKKKKYTGVQQVLFYPWVKNCAKISRKQKFWSFMTNSPYVCIF